jgi:hypothetical protein
MGGPPFAVKLEGVRRLTRAIAAISPALRIELGKANKEIGQRVIANASPKPLDVGQGAGSVPRASANANVLQIRAGGSWRDSRKEQWGPRWKDRDNSRPYLAASGEEDMPNIERDYLDALASVAAKAGLRFIRR